MNAWFTRPSGSAFPEPGSGLSPSLLFHKWHAYDLDEGWRRTDSKDSRVAYLDTVAKAVDRVTAGAEAPYTAWHARFVEALRSCGGEPAEVLEASTVWRMVAGFGSNPALETGLHLHPLLGFPMVPGSGVRGLAHHVAEATLGEEERTRWSAGLPDASEEEVRDRLDERAGPVAGFLAACETVWRLFGSLHLETTPKRREEEVERLAGESDEEAPLPTPRHLLARWRRALVTVRPDEGRELRKRIDGLLDTTGGRLVFYDAVPVPGQSGLLQPDILNPHYPEYYREPGPAGRRHPPSDDQDPIPVYFLAVAPGKAFQLRYRWRTFRGDPPGGDPEKAEGLRLIRQWLQEGLDHWGLGGKTAAGYGYFELPEEEGGVASKQEGA